MRNWWLPVLALVGSVTASPASNHRGPWGRERVCPVKSEGDGRDDAMNILRAIHDCNNGGRVWFKPGELYTIGTALDLSFMNHIDLDIQGTIEFTPDTTYWQEHSFQFVFQNATSFWILGGNDVSIYGGGTINGNGQVWYDLFAQDQFILRPTLMGVEGLHNSVISNLNLRQSPTYHYFVVNSTNVVIEQMNMQSNSDNENQAKNTDGIDIYRSDKITLLDWVVDNHDDCVSFKPNATNIIVQNIHCNGSHGISVGSLGQYPGSYSIVENVLVKNVTMTNCVTGARIKVWPNVPSAEGANLQGGGGSGRVQNIVFEDFFVDQVQYAIEVDQCYGQKNLTLCYDNPSPLTISNVLFKNFQGTTNGGYAPDIATFACSSTTACTDIQTENIQVTGPSQSLAYCHNVDEALLQDINCTGPYKGFY